jgi:hypothetical protein
MIKMSRSGHKGKKMLETIAWVLLLIISGGIIVVTTFVAIFVLSEEK